MKETSFRHWRVLGIERHLGHDIKRTVGRDKEHVGSRAQTCMSQVGATQNASH
jgi:hypothetical protein